jgi:amino acid adenylation domain-containing protein
LINVLEYLDAAAARFPDKVAYTDGKTALTFAETDRISRAVGSYLLERGCSRVPVAVRLPRSPQTVAAFFGVVRAGCCYVPLDPEMGSLRIEGILNDLKPAAVIDSENFAGMSAHPVNDEKLTGARREAIDTDLLYIVYTSGSTGTPKGVAANHRSVIDYIEALSEVLGLGEDTVFGCQAPLYADACLKELYPTVKFGAKTVLLPKELFMFPVKLIQALNEYKINTICWAVSALTMLSGTGALENNPINNLRTVAFGGEVFPQAQLNLWRKTLSDARFFNLYGPTECTGMSCWYEVTRDFGPDEPVPIGRPFRNTRIQLIGGEICIAGTSLTVGYYNDFEKTGAAFIQNPFNTSTRELIYRTGDLGEYNERGELIFKSRRDHQVKIMGNRVELGEIESAAAGLDGISRAACIFDQERKKLVLFYSGTKTPAETAAWLKGKLPRFMCPNAVRQLDKLPLTPTGKTDRKSLAFEWENQGRGQ